MRNFEAFENVRFFEVFIMFLIICRFLNIGRLRKISNVFIYFFLILKFDYFEFDEFGVLTALTVKATIVVDIMPCFLCRCSLTL